MAGKRGNGEGSIYKHDGRWHYQGWISGRRVRVSAPTRAGVLEKWRLREEQERLTITPQARVRLATVGEALEHWYGLNEHRWAASTRTGYRHAIDRQLVPYLGEMAPKELTPAHVEAWQHDRLQSGLSSSTVHQPRVVLSQTMDMLVRYELLTRNPVALAQGLPKAAAEPSFLTADEAARVLDAAEDAPEYARWLLALSLGLRSGEVLGLRWQDLDLDASPPRLSITGTLRFQSGAGLVRSAPKTNASRRTVVLAEPHVAALRATRRHQAAQQLAHVGAFNTDGYVFVTSRGTPIDHANDTKRWHQLLDRAGVRRVRRHDARHTAATLVLSSGAGLAQVQKLLGHTSIRTTVDVYGHLDAAEASRHTAAVAELLDRSSAAM